MLYKVPTLRLNYIFLAFHWSGRLPCLDSELILEQCTI